MSVYIMCILFIFNRHAYTINRRLMIMMSFDNKQIKKCQ